MKKVLIIGCPGSGKSTFARDLHKKTNLPLYYLDQMFWNADKTTVCREVFLARLQEVLSKDTWIIDGNYASSLELRLQHCDTVFFLDYPVDVCLDGVKQRMGKAREDMPWVEMEEDVEFMEYIKKFHEEQRPRMLELLEKYRKPLYVFKNREESHTFLVK